MQHHARQSNSLSVQMDSVFRLYQELIAGCLDVAVQVCTLYSSFPEKHADLAYLVLLWYHLQQSAEAGLLAPSIVLIHN